MEAKPQRCAYLDVDSDKPITRPEARLFFVILEQMPRLHRHETVIIDGEAHRLVGSSYHYMLRLDEEPPPSSVLGGGSGSGHSGRGQGRS